MKKNLMTVTKKAAFAAVFAAAVSAAVKTAPAQAAVKLDKKSVTMYAGQTVTLRLTGTKKNVKWTSAKKAVASVSRKGKITAKKAGKTVIKATVSKKSYACKVTVKNPYLNKKSAVLEAWDVMKLELNGAVAETFASSDRTVASVGTSGTVTARKEGTAVITVTDTKDRTYTCAITVTAAQEEDNAGTDDSTSAGEGTAVNTGSASGSTETQSPAVTQHVHDWVPHYSYAGNGKAVVDGYFCADVTCADNRGYGTDNGWRGETAPGYTSEFGYGTGSTGSTQPSQDVTVNQPVNDNTGNNAGSQAGNTGNNAGNTGNTTDNTQTQAPGAAVTEPEQHHHDYTVPVMSADSLRVEGYACECGERASHNHEWTEEVKRTEGYGAGLIVESYKCACGETISADGYGKLAEANRKASETIKNAWIAQNITAGMTDAEKVKAVMREMNSWTYGEVQGYEMSNVSRKADCLGSNKAFAEYCAAAGVRAEAFDATQMLGVDKHWMAYVWVDGKQCVADATAGGGYFPGTVLMAEGFDLYLDWKAGAVTDEQYDAEIGQYEL